jgi:hypothetical protein
MKVAHQRREDIDLPRMRRDDSSPNADPLLGVKVKINDSYFLIGLNHADADVARNVDEIATRGWFDFPMVLDDGRIAKLTFEKAADGERVVHEALAAWKYFRPYLPVGEWHRERRHT